MNIKKKMKRLYSLEEKEKLLSDYQNSGLSKTVWYKENNICISTLHKWIKAKTANKIMSIQNWMPVEIKPEAKISNSEFITLKLGKISIDVSVATNKKLLVEVLEVVDQLC